LRKEIELTKIISRDEIRGEVAMVVRVTCLNDDDEVVAADVATKAIMAEYDDATGKLIMERFLTFVKTPKPKETMDSHN
jgi:hypothetical protein